MSQTRSHFLGHPWVPGWGLARVPIARLTERPVEAGELYISREEGPDLGRRASAIVANAPQRVLLGIDLRGVSQMPSFLWRQLGPLLQGRTLQGEFGPEKRILYVTGGDEETLRMLTWAYRDVADAASQSAGKRVDRAALAPASERGYCGVLREPYAEVLQFVNARGTATNEDVSTHVEGRYSLNNANNYLTALAELGLIYRRVAPRGAGGYASIAYALSVPEEVMEHAFDLI